MGSVVTVDPRTGRVGIVPPVGEVAAVVPIVDGVADDPIGVVEKHEEGGWLARPADGGAALITATISDAARWLARHADPKHPAPDLGLPTEWQALKEDDR